MANVIINDTYLTNIADAIRSKNGSANAYKPSQMAAAISAIEINSGSGGESGGGSVTYKDTVELRAYANEAYITGDDCAKDIITGAAFGINTYDITGFNNCPRLKVLDLSEMTNGGWIYPVYDCPNLEKVIFHTAAAGEYGATYVWEPLEGEVEYGFKNCPKLKTIVFPDKASFGSNIGTGSSIEKIYFRGKPAGDVLERTYDSSINDYKTFLSNCERLTDIYVPWSQGEVTSDANWWDPFEDDQRLISRGVAVHYNYVFTGNEE